MNFIGQWYNQIMNWVVTHFALLFPAGSVAQAQRDLMLWATVLMLVVVLPVFIMTVVIAVRYREGNTKARFTPKWDHNLTHELIWWGVPIVIVGILGFITWNSTHALDPYKAIPSENKPVVIQTISLDWKWLFIYPNKGIATVNAITVPEDTPVVFRITSDAPMNALWMPEIVGMVMTMPGMITELNMIVPERGVYQGMSANYSGRGFAGMDFTIDVVGREDFGQWVKKIQKTDKVLSLSRYEQLSEPSSYVPVMNFRLGYDNLFRYVVMKYMMPSHHYQKNSMMEMEAMNGMDMKGMDS